MRITEWVQREAQRVEQWQELDESYARSLSRLPGLLLGVKL